MPLSAAGTVRLPVRHKKAAWEQAAYFRVKLLSKDQVTVTLQTTAAMLRDCYGNVTEWLSL
jgi:hypothetical protein